MAKPQPIRVRATATGFCGQLLEKGAVFHIADEAAFAASWMERLDPQDAAPAVETNANALTYSIKHVPVGSWVVVDAEGKRASVVFKKADGDPKALAQAEAIRLNAGGELVLDGPTGGGAPPTEPAPAVETDPTLPDA